MSTLQLILAGILGIVLGALALFASAPATTVQNTSLPPVSEIASSSPKKIPSQTAETSASPQETPSQKNPTPAPQPAAQTQNTTSGTQPATENTSSQTPAAPAIAPTALNGLVRNAVVNIICTTETSGPFNSISASGVIIDSHGIILTNAHVGQYFLLKDYPKKDFVSCVIRTGSPATPAYTARLLFLPPTWIAQNASKINSEEPTGNGEHDYALLLITGSANQSTPLPASFASLPISVDPPDGGQNVFLAAYPAGFLGGITVAKDLYQSSAFTTVGDLFTFDANTLDLFSVGGTILSQHGSSGGAVTDENGVLVGLIVTATDAVSTAARDLRAISTPYIIHDFIKETAGTSLQAYLSGNLSAEANAFNANTAPALTQELITAIEAN